MFCYCVLLLYRGSARPRDFPFLERMFTCIQTHSSRRVYLAPSSCPSRHTVIRWLVDKIDFRDPSIHLAFKAFRQESMYQTTRGARGSDVVGEASLVAYGTHDTLTMILHTHTCAICRTAACPAARLTRQFRSTVVPKNLNNPSPIPLLSPSPTPPPPPPPPPPRRRLDRVVRPDRHHRVGPRCRLRVGAVQEPLRQPRPRPPRRPRHRRRPQAPHARPVPVSPHRRRRRRHRLLHHPSLGKLTRF